MHGNNQNYCEDWIVPLSVKQRGRVDDFLFFDCLSPFCSLLIEFHCNSFHFFKILPYYVHYYSILIRM